MEILLPLRLFLVSAKKPLRDSKLKLFLLESWENFHSKHIFIYIKCMKSSKKKKKRGLRRHPQRQSDRDIRERGDGGGGVREDFLHFQRSPVEVPNSIKALSKYQHYERSRRLMPIF